MKGRFFVTLDAEVADRAYLDAAGARHLRALRLARGDTVCAIVAPGRERAASIASLERDRVVLALGAELPASARDPQRQRTLAIAVGDLARMDLVVEKATELGATAIQPFVAARSQGRGVAPARIERWRRIAHAACEQCGRTIAPHIHPCVDFAALLAPGDGGRTVWLLDPAGSPAGEALVAAASAPAQPSVASTGSEPPPRADAEMLLVVGPEGGLSDAEIAALRAHGARSISLGRRILRFETAAIAALAAAATCLPDDA